MGNNLNGEYVKFYTTTNKQLPELLKNSGSIIIYTDINNDTNQQTNYIYFNGKLIASGIGFNNIDIKNKLEKISYLYGPDISIDTILSYINSNSNKIDDLESIIDNSLIKNEGDISGTSITINNNKFNICDFLTKSINAKYIEPEISILSISVTYIINGLTYTTTFNIDEELILPVGALITGISTKINIVCNDSGGLSSLNAKFYKTKIPFEYNEGNLVTEEIQIFEGANKKYPIIYNEVKLSDNIIEEIYYKLNNGFYYINYGENILIDEISISTHETPKEKYKPYIFKGENDENIIKNNILSIENILYTKTYILPKIKIKGEYCLLNYNIPYDIANKNISISNFSKLSNRYKIDLTNKINIPSTSNKIIFAIPENYKLISVYLQNSTGIYNWSGYVNNTNTSFDNDKKIYLYDRGDNTQAPTTLKPTVTIKYNIYYIDYDNLHNNNIGENCNLIINIENLSTTIYKYYNSSLSTKNIIDNNYYKPLQDEIFNNLYWHDSNFINTLNITNKMYITTSSSFLDNPISFENSFLNMDSLDTFINRYNNNRFGSGKLSILIPKYYDNSFIVKVNNYNKELSKKLIKYNNCDYIILYSDGFSITNSDIVSFEKTYKVYIGSDPLIVYNKFYEYLNSSKFVIINKNAFNGYQYSVNENDINKHLFFIFPYSWYSQNLKIKTYRSGSSTPDRELPYEIYENFKIHETDFIILRTSDPLDVNINTPIFIFK